MCNRHFFLSVFHGFRRRSKLSEAELEDQRALEQVPSALPCVAMYAYSALQYSTVLAQSFNALYCCVVFKPSDLFLARLIFTFTVVLPQGGDGALLVARGRYKCGRCGQLKVSSSNGPTIQHHAPSLVRLTAFSPRMKPHISLTLTRNRTSFTQTNHVCEYYEDTSVCSTATQIASEIIDPATALPWDGERFIVVGCKRAVSQLTV
jgi:hypothetical protein